MRIPLSIPRFAWVGTAVACLFLTGCIVTSIAPFYTEKDKTYDPALLGTWQKRDASESWSFEPAKTNGYRLVVISGDETNVMFAQPFTLKGNLFLDLAEWSPKAETSPPPVPCHMLIRVAETKPLLRLQLLSYKWLEERLKSKPRDLRHQWVRTESEDGERLVLTDDTREVQKFIIKHLKTKEAWEEDEIELEKARP